MMEAVEVAALLLLLLLLLLLTPHPFLSVSCHEHPSAFVMGRIMLNILMSTS